MSVQSAMRDAGVARFASALILRSRAAASRRMRAALMVETHCFAMLLTMRLEKDASRLLQERGLQDEALHLLGVALDLVRIAGEADVLDQRAALERLRGALHLQVLDQRHRVAVIENGAVGIAGFFRHGKAFLELIDEAQCLADVDAPMPVPLACARAAKSVELFGRPSPARAAKEPFSRSSPRRRGPRATNEIAEKTGFPPSRE